MIKQAIISFSKMKKYVLFFGMANCAIYIILFLAFKYLNLREITGLRIINYVAFLVMSLYEIHWLVKKNNRFIPFLEAFLTVFITGTISFFIFAIFIFISSFADPYLNQLFFSDSAALNRFIAALLVFFEGSGGAIIIALIGMMYASRYQDGEAKIN